LTELAYMITEIAPVTSGELTVRPEHIYIVYTINSPTVIRYLKSDQLIIYKFTLQSLNAELHLIGYKTRYDTADLDLKSVAFRMYHK